MQFDLIKAILLKEHRKGNLFYPSPSLLAMVNARIDRLRRELAGQTMEQGSRANAPAASGSAERSGAVSV
jgi:hypothetical protein